MKSAKNLVRPHWLGSLLLLLACSYIFHVKTLANTAPENSRYLRDITVASKFCPADFTPDGDLSKKVWQHAPRLKFDHDSMGHGHYPQYAMQIASLWSADYVYFAYWCKYDSFNIFEGEDPAPEKNLLWTRDVVEVFLNPQPDRFNHYYEFEVAPNNQWVDLVIDLSHGWSSEIGWNSHFDHATRIDAQHHMWMTEMRIPVKPMEVSAVRAGDKWRLNFYRLGGPSEEALRYFMCWSPLPPGGNKSYHQPASFGIIKFVK